MCITKSLCCAAKINTTLLINYTSIKFTKKKKKNPDISSCTISWCIFDISFPVQPISIPFWLNFSIQKVLLAPLT